MPPPRRAGGHVIHVTIYGAGAIGGFTGASLARHGHDVLLVDNAEPHVAAMNASGLTIETPGGEWTSRVRAVTPVALTGPHDLVLLSVKSSTRRPRWTRWRPAWRPAAPS